VVAWELPHIPDHRRPHGACTITTTATATAAGPILAIDLGKYKCVACVYRAADRYTFHTIDTSVAEVERLIRRTRPAVVVIEACSLSGWVHDLCGEIGVPCRVANTGAEAWSGAGARWTWTWPDTYAPTHRRPWADGELALLGTLPDARLARQLDRSRRDVRREREARGIPKYHKPAPPESLLPAEERERLRRRRIRAGKLGKPRPPHVLAALRKASRNLRFSSATRKKMSAAQRARRARGDLRIPCGRIWTADEDELARTLPPAEAAARTGRTLGSVYSRRGALEMAEGRRR
jgi:hypothetical protein